MALSNIVGKNQSGLKRKVRSGPLGASARQNVPNSTAKIGREKRFKLRAEDTNDFTYEDCVDVLKSIEIDTEIDGEIDYNDRFLLREFLSHPQHSTKLFEEFKNTDSRMFLFELFGTEGISLDVIRYILNKVSHEDRQAFDIVAVARHGGIVDVEVIERALASHYNELLNGRNPADYDLDDVRSYWRGLRTSPILQRSDIPSHIRNMLINLLLNESRNYLKTSTRKVHAFTSGLGESLSVYDMDDWVSAQKRVNNNSDFINLLSVLEFERWITNSDERDVSLQSSKYDNKISVIWSFLNYPFNARMMDAYRIDEKSDSDIIDSFLMSDDSSVRLALAMNEHLEDHVYEDLADDEDILVQLMVLLNKKTPTYVLDQLSYSSNDLMKVLVAQHDNTSSETLVRLFNNAVQRDTEEKENNKISENDSNSLMFSNDSSFGDLVDEIRIESMLNKNFPVELLEEMLAKAELNNDVDEWRLITSSSAWGFTRLMEFIESDDSAVRFNALTSRNLPNSAKHLFV